MPYDLLVKTNSIPQMQLCDLAISINDIARYKVFDLKQITKVYRSGYDNTKSTLLAAGFKDMAELKGRNSDK